MSEEIEESAYRCSELARDRRVSVNVHEFDTRTFGRILALLDGGSRSQQNAAACSLKEIAR